MLNTRVDMSLEALLPHFPSANRIKLKFSLNMIFSVIWMPGLLAGSPKDYGWVNLGDPAEWGAFLDYAVDLIFRLRDWVTPLRLAF